MYIMNDPVIQFSQTGKKMVYLLNKMQDSKSKRYLSVWNEKLLSPLPAQLSSLHTQQVTIHHILWNLR